MFPWILLKIIPSLSNYFEIPDIRQAVYLFLAFLVLLLIIMKYAMFRASKPDKCFLILLMLFFMVLLLNAGNQHIAGRKAETFLLARSLFLVITLSILLKYNTDKSFLLYSLLLYFSVVQILSILVYLNIVSSTPVLSDERNVGIMSSTFNLSYSSSIYTGILLIYLEHCKSIAIRIAVVFMLIVCIINSYFAVSRSSIIGISLIGLFWFLEKARGLQHVNYGKIYRKRGFLLIVFLIVFLIYGMLFFTSFKDNSNYISYIFNIWKVRMTVLLNEGIEGQRHRWLTNTVGLNIFLKHPLTGVGWDNVAFFGRKYGGANSTAHNVLIRSAAEGGILGIAFSVLLFFIIPYTLFVRYKQVPGSYIFMGSWLSIIAYNMVASNLHYEAHWDLLFFWMVLTSLFQRNMQLKVSGPGIFLDKPRQKGH